jgi:hypothetical protein
VGKERERSPREELCLEKEPTRGNIKDTQKSRNAVNETAVDSGNG